MTPSASTRSRVMAWWNRFWFAEIPPHIYALLRMLFGALGCLMLVGLIDLPLFWSCDGLVASRDEALCQWMESSGIGWLPGAVLLLLISASFVAMAVGFYTRIAVVAAFASMQFIASWNQLPLSSAHQVMRCVLFCLIWPDSGLVWSVDAWRARRRAPGGADVGGLSGVPSWPLQLIRIQVAVIYFVTGLWKLGNATWRDGSALHYVFQNNQFRRFSPPGGAGWDTVMTLATYATLLWELSFAFLVLHRRTRRWALLAGVAIHVGMWLTLELGPFSWVMLASYVAFLNPESVPGLPREPGAVQTVVGPAKAGPYV